MDDETLRQAAYLRTLSEIAPSLGHEIRSVLGNLSLHVDLLDETVRREAPALGADARERLERYARSLKDDVRASVRAVERTLALTRGPAVGDTAFDLRELHDDLDGVLGPYLAGRRLGWSADRPAGVVEIDGDREAALRLLLVRVVEASRQLPAGGRLALWIDATPHGGTARIECRGPEGTCESQSVALALRLRAK